MLGVDKLDIAKFFNVPNSLNNFSVGKLNTVPIDLKNFSDVADNQVVKNTKDSAATTLIHINQCSTDKQNLEKKMEILIKNTRR